MRKIMGKHLINNSKIIITGLLLVTLLFVTLFIPSKENVNAAPLTFENGDKVKITLTDNVRANFVIEGEYKNGVWVNSKSTSTIAGMELNDKPACHYICENYNFNSTKNNATDMTAKFLECIAKGDGEFSYDLKGTINDGGAKSVVFLQGNNGNPKWSNERDYKNAILEGSITRTKQDGTNKDPMINPCCMNGDGDYFDETVYYGVNTLSTMLDGELIPFFIHSGSVLGSYLTIEKVGEEEVTNETEGDMYQAEVTSDSNSIYIVVKNMSGVEVTRFLYADITSGDSYRERKYQSATLTNVRILNSNGSLVATANPAANTSDQSLYLYYEKINSTNKTLDNYYNSIIKASTSPDFKLASNLYTAINDGSGNIDIYVGTKAKDKNCSLTKVLTVSKEMIDSMFTRDDDQLVVGDWIFEQYRDSIIVAYKEGESDIASNGFYYDFSTIKRIFVKDDDYLDIFIAVKKGKQGRFNYGYPKLASNMFSLIRSEKNPEEKGKNTELIKIKEEFFRMLGEDGSNCYAVTCKLKYDNANGSGAGSENDNKIKVSDLIKDGCELSGTDDLPPDIPLNELLSALPDFKDRIGKAETDIHVDLNASLGQTKSEVKRAFIEDILKYGKIILLFFVLIALIYTAIIAIRSGHDTQLRVQIKTRLKNIIIGIIIFMISVPLFQIILAFASQSYTELEAIADSYTGPTFYATVTRYQTGWLVNLIGFFVDVATDITNWLVDGVLATCMAPGETIDLMHLIYGVTDPTTGQVSSLIPFTAGEWGIYMEGYKMLAVIAICFIAIALVKISGEMILNAGDYQKQAESKESLVRIVYGIIAIVLVPYAFRLLFLLFNYLTAMLPIDGESASFDIDFDCDGIVGSVANFIFAVTRFRIFITFFVRKVLIAFMMISSPVVLSMWCISQKFRGFSMWIGEIFSNTAVQFCYGLVMLVVMLITYDGQNPFITLIIVSLLPKLASFFSKSLQGLAQRWGSINIEQQADDIVNGFKRASHKVKGSVVKSGRFLMKSAAFFDKDGVSKTGRNVHNVGAILSGDVLNVRTKKEMAENRYRLSKDESDKDSKMLNEAEKNLLPWINDANHPEYKEYLSKLKAGGVEEDDMLHGEGFDQINDWYDLSKKANLSKHRTNGYKELAKHYGSDTLIGKIADKNEGPVGNTLNKINESVLSPVSFLQAKAQGTKVPSKTRQTAELVDKATDTKSSGTVNMGKVFGDIEKMQRVTEGTQRENLAKAGQEKLVKDNIDGIELLLSNDSNPTQSKLDAADELLSVIANYSVHSEGKIDDAIFERIEKIQSDYEERIISETESYGVGESSMEDFTAENETVSFDKQDETTREVSTSDSDVSSSEEKVRSQNFRETDMNATRDSILGDDASLDAFEDTFGESKGTAKDDKPSEAKDNSSKNKEAKKDDLTIEQEKQIVNIVDDKKATEEQIEKLKSNGVSENDENMIKLKQQQKDLQARLEEKMSDYNETHADKTVDEIIKEFKKQAPGERKLEGGVQENHMDNAHATGVVKQNVNNIHITNKPH
ncbi:MAG: hypothetical protein MJ245_07040 [Clostridia bacterium]|nr:hypothetical protein [Clostridia bacterium]